MQTFKSVDEFIKSLDESKRTQVNKLRELIINAEPTLTESIKWNAPNYNCNGEDRVTFNVLNKEGIVKLILHMGATRKENKKGNPVLHDTTGLIEWNSDIRGILKFTDLNDINTKHDEVTKIIKDWLALK